VISLPQDLILLMVEYPKKTCILADILAFEVYRLLDGMVGA